MRTKGSVLAFTNRNSRKAIFLDRDGTLNKNVEYLIDFEHFELLPGVEKALHLFQDLDFRLFVVTNQSGVARGLFPIQAVVELHRRIGQLMAAKGIHLEEFVFCPHHPQGSVPEYTLNCSCRKPKPGMLRYLETKYHLDTDKSYMVGDAYRDAQAGLQAGAFAVLLKPNADPNAAWDLDPLDNPGNIKEFISLLGFAESLGRLA
jgi:D-glycero-D-manno-heptose 1,7-bisphosphate phosphatase